MTTLLTERRARTATTRQRSQQRMRAINDDVRRVLRAGAGDRIPFFCECATPGCFLPLWLTLAEYDALSAGSAFGSSQAHAPASDSASRREERSMDLNDKVTRRSPATAAAARKGSGTQTETTA